MCAKRKIDIFISNQKMHETRLFFRKGGFCLVRRKGLEPPTYWFVASHSIQLSYRRIPRIALRYSSTEG